MSNIVTSLAELLCYYLQHIHHPLSTIQQTSGLLIKDDIILYFLLQLVIHFLVLHYLLKDFIYIVIDEFVLG